MQPRPTELEIGETYYYKWSEGGGAEIVRTNEGYELYEVPLYGGDPRFYKVCSTLIEAEGVADKWT